MRYRADIDGLRAVAVLPVVLFHLGVAPFGGGFVGVDVFFVLSGYLITGLILPDIRSGRFSLLGFYERRCRRLFPALATVLTASAAIGFAVLLPYEFEKFGETLVAASLSVSNILFANQTGYFAAGALAKPLLNTWSLAVEEQFYLIYPLLLLALVRIWPRRVTLALLAVALVSLAWSIEAAWHHRAAAYFHLYTRGFELLIGALLAAGAIPAIKDDRIGTAASFGGIGLIAFAVFAFGPTTPFPGYAALVPCVGTALLLHAGAGRASFAQRMLAWTPLVFVGRISYPLYLWHWPLIVFFTQAMLRLPTFPEKIGIAAVSFGLSVLTWRYIETPIRERRAAATPVALFRIAGTCTAAAVAFGLLVMQTSGLPHRLPADVAEMAAHRASRSSVHGSCVAPEWPPGFTVDMRGSFCVIGDPDQPRFDFVLVGDSHAQAMAAEVGERAAQLGLRGITFLHAGCLPLLGLDVMDARFRAPCLRLAELAVDAVERLDIRTVIWIARWRFRMNEPGYGLEGLAATAVADGEGPGDNDTIVTRSLLRTLDRLQDRSVVILAGIPEIGVSVPALMAQSLRFDRPPPSGPTRLEHEARQAPVSLMLALAARRSNVTVLNPADILCAEARCLIARGGIPLYTDDDHLSIAGARLLAPVFDPALMAVARPSGPIMSSNPDPDPVQ